MRVLFIIVLMLYFSYYGNAQIKILPLGNSITQGKADQNTYRRDLWNLLYDVGYQVDFIGTVDKTSGGINFPGLYFDNHHEGHWGWRADQIEDHLKKWLLQYSPDIVLIHLGTNDIRDNQSIQSTANEIGTIIDILRNDNPQVTIFLAQIIPAGWLDPEGDLVPELNHALAELAKNKNRLQSRIIIVDHNKGWINWLHTYDGVHPNKLGAARMARNWFMAINAYLKRSHQKE